MVLRRWATEPRYRARRLSVRVVPAPRFRLPADPARPVVMVAGGSGIASFLGFVAARADAPRAAGDVLFHAARTSADVVTSPALDRALAEGRVVRHLALSGDAGVRVPDLLARPEHADHLWQLLAGGGPPAHLYVCGRAAFAAAVVDSVTALAATRLGSTTAGAGFVRRLVADGRLQFDVFTTYTGHAQSGPVHDVSDLVLRTTAERGCAMAVAGRVHDMTEFVHLHAGGPHVVRHNLGVDATDAYRRVLHDRNPEVDALLAMYDTGSLRRLRFGAAWGVAVTADGLQAVTVQDFFAAWVRYTYLVVGMANALRSDYGFAGGPTTGGEAPGGPSRFTSQFVVEAHRRFLVSHLDGLLADDLAELWAVTAGLCDPTADAGELPASVAALADDPAHAVVRRTIGRVKEQVLAPATPGWSTDPSTPAEVVDLCRTWAAEDLRVLEDVVGALREGLLAFEAHEADVLTRGGAALLASLRSVPGVVADYYRRVAAATAAAGVPTDLGASPAPDVADEPVPVDRGLPGHGGPA